MAEDTITRDIPLHFRTSFMKTVIQKEFSFLNLQSIENGYADLQIRFWTGQGNKKTDDMRVIIIKKTGSNLTAETVTYSLQTNVQIDSFYFTNKITGLITPHSGWVCFMDSLQKTEVYELPDYENLKDYKPSADADGVTVEIASKSRYRIYQYTDIDDKKNKYPEAMKMYRVLNFLENEFGVSVVSRETK